MANGLVGADLIERLAWTLVHSLWQGTLIALVAAWLRLMLQSPRWRYGVSAGALFLMLVLPVLTFISMGSGGAAAPLNFLPAAGEPVLVSSELLEAAGSFEAGGSVSALPWPQWIVMTWLAGVVVCLVRLLAAWHATRLLLTRGTAPAPPAVAELLSRLCARLRLVVPVRLLQSAHVDTPVVIGWLRPVVLLPAAAVTGLTPAQLEAILAHELAHVRRHDFLVNVLQRGVESLLFYHPAVWWLSARIRADREECCDDVALASCRNAATYASALVELELERSRSVGSLAMASTGGNLTRRVRRLLDGASTRRDWREVLPAVALVAAVLVTALHGADALRAQPAAEEMPEPPLSQEVPVSPSSQDAPVRQAPRAGEEPPVPQAPRTPEEPAVPEPEPLPGISPAAQEPQVLEPTESEEPPGSVVQRDGTVVVQPDGAFIVQRDGVYLRGPGGAPLVEFGQFGPVGSFEEWLTERGGAPPVEFVQFGQYGGTSWVLFQGDTVLMSGSSMDMVQARAAQARLDTDLLWFRHRDGNTYVIREPELLQRVIEMHAPLHDLAERQRAMAEEQRRLAEEMREVRVEVDMSTLEARLAELAAQLPGAATQGELSEVQRALGELQREVGRLQAEAGREQARIGRLQGEQGRRQAELGREQAEASRRLDREVRELLQEAVRGGTATRE